MSELKKIKQLPTANNLDNLNLNQIGDLANRKGQECLDLRVKSAIAGYECGLILIAARERVERELGKMKFSAWLRDNWKHSRQYAYRFIEFAEDESCQQVLTTNPDLAFNAASKMMKGLASKEKTQKQIEDETLEQQIKRKDFELQQIKAQKDVEIAELKAKIEIHEKERQRQERIQKIKETCEKEEKESRIKRRKQIESNIEEYRKKFIEERNDVIELAMAYPDLVEEAVEQENRNLAEIIELVNEGKCDEDVIDYFIWLSHERLRNILKSIRRTDMDAYAQIADWEIEDEEFELEMKREEELAKREEELMV